MLISMPSLMVLVFNSLLLSSADVFSFSSAVSSMNNSATTIIRSFTLSRNSYRSLPLASQLSP